MSVTLKLRVGNETLSGLTFSSVAQVEEIEAYIAMVGASNTIVNLLKRSRTDQQGVYGEMTENIDITADLDISLIMTADTIDDVDYHEGKYAGLKNITVELV